MRRKHTPTATEFSSGPEAPYRESEALEGPTNIQKAVATDDPNDVGNKIKGMLAASEFLKPGSTQRPEAAERKRPRAVSASILKKLSNVVAKLKPKTKANPLLELEETERRVREHRRTASEYIGGINFHNNQEAPRFASMEIKRKPLPPKPLPPKPSLPEPSPPEPASPEPASPEPTSPEPSPLKPLPRSVAFFGEPYKAIQLSDNDSENDLDKASFEELEFSEPQQNPFDSEDQFEADIEGRILDSIPEATSTPRLGRSKLVRFSLPDEEMLQSDDGFERDSILEHPAQRLGDSIQGHHVQNSGVGSHGHLVQNRGDGIHGHLVQRPRDSIQGHLVQGPGGYVAVKKHPSPDKRWLESLSQDFVAYRTLKAAGAGDEELNELAERYILPSRVRSDKTSKRVQSFSSSSSDDASAAHAGTGSPLRFRGSLRHSRAVGNLASMRFHGRQEHPFRPTNADADDPDELQ